MRLSNLLDHIFPIPDLVEKFYTRFAKSDVANDHKSFQLEWGGQTLTEHVGTISAATGILLHNEKKTLFVIEKNPTKMDPSCTIT